MKKLFLISFSLLVVQVLLAQSAGPLSLSELRRIDSLKARLEVLPPDTNRLKTLTDLSYAYNTYRKEALPYAREAAELALKLENKGAQSAALNWLAIILQFQGRTPEALTLLLQALRISEEVQNKQQIGVNTKQIGFIYTVHEDYEKAKPHLWRSKSMLEETGNNYHLAITLWVLGRLHSEAGSQDSAGIYLQKAVELGLKSRNFFPVARSLISLGDIYNKKDEPATSLEYYRQSLTYGIPLVVPGACLAMAKTFEKIGQSDSALLYGTLAFDTANVVSQLGSKLAASQFLSAWYNGRNTEEAYKYLKTARQIEDSIRSDEETLKIQNIAFQEQQNLQEIEAAKVQTRNRMRLYIILGALISLLVVAAILLHNNRSKQRANEILKRQKHEIDVQRSRAEQAFKELKATQSQLIQSEKMASLGELTAGIAHEIQNPLNFVNNFSEVNKELVDELKSELAIGNMQLANEIADNIKENEEKINHHGQRADGIVKSMLQHSRSSSGKKEPTNINALADEYFKLAYHGLRAKDNSFNVITKTDFDETIGKINMIPQDIGRVILNLITNAFYAVTEKKKQELNGYEPLVTVSTKRIGSPSGNGVKIEITVADNGNGIPQKVLDKIFQPFFTTKPTGVGTGLGLSLSYDIVKAHSGELKVETKEGEGSEFIILFPVV